MQEGRENRKADAGQSRPAQEKSQVAMVKTGSLFEKGDDELRLPGEMHGDGWKKTDTLPG